MSVSPACGICTAPTVSTTNRDVASTWSSVMSWPLMPVNQMTLDAP
jgi:hypothetical protein